MGKLDCRICYTKNRDEIESLLIEGAPMVQISRQYSALLNVDVHLLEQSIASHRMHIPKELTEEEKLFLNRIQTGEAGIDEISRIVAARVFENMLRNPDDVRFVDFYRSQLLLMNEEKQRTQDAWAKEVICRMFAGKLPPREISCGRCGHVESW